MKVSLDGLNIRLEMRKTEKLMISEIKNRPIEITERNTGKTNNNNNNRTYIKQIQ